MCKIIYLLNINIKKLIIENIEIMCSTQRNLNSSESYEKITIIIINNSDSFVFQVYPWCGIYVKFLKQELKQKIELATAIPKGLQRLFVLNHEMKNSKKLLDYKTKNYSKINLIYS